MNDVACERGPLISYLWNCTLSETICEQNGCNNCNNCFRGSFCYFEATDRQTYPENQITNFKFCSDAPDVADCLCRIATTPAPTDSPQKLDEPGMDKTAAIALSVCLAVLVLVAIVVVVLGVRRYRKTRSTAGKYNPALEEDKFGAVLERSRRVNEIPPPVPGVEGLI